MVLSGKADVNITFKELKLARVEGSQNRANLGELTLVYRHQMPAGGAVVPVQ